MGRKSGIRAWTGRVTNVTYTSHRDVNKIPPMSRNLVLCEHWFYKEIFLENFYKLPCTVHKEAVKANQHIAN